MNELKVAEEVWYFCNDTDAPGVGVVLSSLRLFNGIVSGISSKGVCLIVTDHIGEEIVKRTSCFTSKLEAICSMKKFLSELEGKS